MSTQIRVIVGELDRHDQSRIFPRLHPFTSSRELSNPPRVGGGGGGIAGRTGRCWLCTAETGRHEIGPSWVGTCGFQDQLIPYSTYWFGLGDLPVQLHLRFWLPDGAASAGWYVVQF